MNTKHLIFHDRALAVIMVLSVLLGLIACISNLLEKGFDFKNFVASLLVGGSLSLFCFLGLGSSFIRKEERLGS